jgi:hypothetical protein
LCALLGGSVETSTLAANVRLSGVEGAANFAPSVRRRRNGNNDPNGGDKSGHLFGL